MFIKNIKLQNYRNYNEVNVELDKNINILYGNNAEGKTNFIESIYLAATSKSHKNIKEQDIIKFGEKIAHIKILLNKQEKDYIIDIQINKDLKKGIAINGNKIDKISNYLGFLNVVMFSPEDLYIIKDGPQARRKFIDLCICKIDKLYINSLSKYNKLLNERNVILKDINNSLSSNKNELIEVLMSLDEQFIKYGTDVIKRRNKYINELKQKIYDIYNKITDNKEKMYISYETNVIENLSFEKDIKEQEKIKNIFEQKLQENLQNDIKNAYTNIGPHRDDICFSIDEKDIRKFGSQGQKKTVAISIKLSELYLIKEKFNDIPILLLDDVFSELDEIRQKMIIKSLNDIQTIITCTGIKKNIFELLKPNKILKVSNGEIK